MSNNIDGICDAILGGVQLARAKGVPVLAEHAILFDVCFDTGLAVDLFKLGRDRRFVRRLGREPAASEEEAVKLAADMQNKLNIRESVAFLDRARSTPGVCKYELVLLSGLAIVSLHPAGVVFPYNMTS